MDSEAWSRPWPACGIGSTSVLCGPAAHRYLRKLQTELAWGMQGRVGREPLNLSKTHHPPSWGEGCRGSPATASSLLMEGAKIQFRYGHYTWETPHGRQHGKTMLSRPEISRGLCKCYLDDFKVVLQVMLVLLMPGQEELCWEIPALCIPSPNLFMGSTAPEAFEVEYPALWAFSVSFCLLLSGIWRRRSLLDRSSVASCRHEWDLGTSHLDPGGGLCLEIGCGEWVLSAAAAKAYRSMALGIPWGHRWTALPCGCYCSTPVPTGSESSQPTASWSSYCMPSMWTR